MAVDGWRWLWWCWLRVVVAVVVCVVVVVGVVVVVVVCGRGVCEWWRWWRCWLCVVVAVIVCVCVVAVGVVAVVVVCGCGVWVRVALMLLLPWRCARCVWAALACVVGGGCAWWYVVCVWRWQLWCVAVACVLLCRRACVCDGGCGGAGGVWGGRAVVVVCVQPRVWCGGGGGGCVRVAVEWRLWFLCACVRGLGPWPT